MKYLLSFLLSFLLILTLHAQSGTLDPSFADGGKLIQTQASYLTSAPLAIQKDGKIVVGSSGNYGEAITFRVTRYLSDGSIDESFGNKGDAYAPFPQFNLSSYNAQITAMALLPDGKIIAAQGFFGVYLALYNPDGTLDSSFGINGTMLSGSANIYTITSIVVQPDGKIVLGGSESITHGTDENVSTSFVLFRITPDGKPDESFGKGGRAVSATGTEIASLSLQPDGKIIAGGRTGIIDAYSNLFYVERYMPDGTIDKSFGDNGGTTTVFENQSCFINSIALQEDGKIVATGATGFTQYPNILLARYDAYGKLDRTFNDSGKVVTRSPVNGTRSNSVLVQPDGKIVVGGSNYDGLVRNSGDIALVCYNTDGSLDKEFGNGGFAITDIYGGDGVSMAALQPDGKIVVSSVSYKSAYAVVLARYNTSQSAVLPLALTQFTAMQNERGVALNWQTATETNTNYFSVQRSIPNSVYTEIAKVKSIGYSTTPHNYTYIDNAPAAGANTYQLKVVDKDGTATYSKATSVNYAIGKILKLYPNPAHNTVTVEGLDASATTTISLLDARGKIIKQQVSSGSAKNTVSLANLAAGTYYLKAESGTNTTTIKFVKE